MRGCPLLMWLAEELGLGLSLGCSSLSVGLFDPRTPVDRLPEQLPLLLQARPVGVRERLRAGSLLVGEAPYQHRVAVWHGWCTVPRSAAPELAKQSVAAFAAHG